MEQNILKKAALKSTKKRQMLLFLLEKQARPMTAEELHEAANVILPMNVSTVYRTLNTLTEKPIIPCRKKTITIVWSAIFAARSSQSIPVPSANWRKLYRKKQDSASPVIPWNLPVFARNVQKKQSFEY